MCTVRTADFSRRGASFVYSEKKFFKGRSFCTAVLLRSLLEVYLLAFRVSNEISGL